MSDAISRRTLLGGALALSAVGLPAAAAPAALDHFVYVGCRTTRERNARGDGVAIFRAKGADPWTPLQVVGDLVNPSFLAFDRSKKFLYAVHGDMTEISAFAVDNKTGALRFLNRQSTRGLNPVHVAPDPSNKFLVVTNHLTKDEYQSNLAVLPRQTDGSLGPAVDVMPLTGKIGPHRVEQPFAKPHQAVFDPAGKFIVVPDKGCDLVRSFRLGGDGKLTAIGAPAIAREGAGPRHVAFHPARPFAYVVNELDSTVTAYRYEAESGQLTPFQILSSLPDNFTGNSRASEIEVSPDGRFVHASNRGHDSIASFAINPENGRLASAGWQSSGGKTPRFFCLSPAGDTLFVANEDSDSIVRLADSSVAAKTGSPTCLLFLQAE